MNHSSERKTCFVIAPIGEEGSAIRQYSDKVLDQIITPALSSTYEVVRIDKVSEPTLIDYSIFERLVNADLVVADLTHFNPNVFYELGIRHCVGLPIIHLLKKGQKIPFDIRGFRTIGLDIDNSDSIMDTRNAMKKQAESIEEGKKFVTPVSQFPELLSSLIFTGLESFCAKGKVYDYSESTLETSLTLDESIIKEISLYETVARTTIDLSHKQVNRVDACLATVDKLILSNSMVNLLDVSEAKIAELDIRDARIIHLDASRSEIGTFNRARSNIIIIDTWRAKIGTEIQ